MKLRITKPAAQTVQTVFRTLPSIKMPSPHPYDRSRSPHRHRHEIRSDQKTPRDLGEHARFYKADTSDKYDRYDKFENSNKHDRYDKYSRDSEYKGRKHTSRSPSRRRYSNDTPSSSKRGRSPPRKNKIGSHDVPDSFSTSDLCWDTNEIYGLNLPRSIATTAWSIKQGLAGKPIESLSVLDTTYDGPNSYGLRLLASGRYVSLEFTRSFKESCIIQHCLQLMRARQESNKTAPIIDIDHIAEHLARQKNMAFTLPGEKKAVYNLIADHMISALKAISPIKAEEALRATIEKLEKENAKLRVNPAAPAPSTKNQAKNTIKAALAKGANNLPVADDHEPDDLAPPEEEAPEVDSLEKYRKKSSRPFLATQCPASKATKDYNAFVNGLKLSGPRKKALDKAVESSIVFLRALDNNDKAQLDSVAVEWGLPVKIAATMDATNLMKTIAVAKFMTS